MDGLSRIDSLIVPISTNISYILQRNVKLAKSIVSTLTAQNNEINFLFEIGNTYSLR